MTYPIIKFEKVKAPKLKKGIIPLFIFLIMLYCVLAITGAKTAFDDGTGVNNNITFNRTTKTITKYLTLPTNSTISYATINLIGSDRLDTNAGYNISQSYETLSKIPNYDGFFASDGGSKIVMINMTGSNISQFTLNKSCINQTGWDAPYAINSIHAVNNETLYFTSEYPFMWIVKLNYSMKNTHGCPDYRIVTQIDPLIETMNGLFVDNTTTYAYVSDGNNNKIYKMNISCFQTNVCNLLTNNSGNTFYALPRSYEDLVSNDNGNTFYSVSNNLYLLNSTFNATKYYSYLVNLIPTNLNALGFDGLAYNGTYFWSSDSGNSPLFQKTFNRFKIEYPSDVLVKVNGTIVFNNTGSLNGTNTSINLNAGNVLTTCYNFTGTCNFDFVSTTIGLLQLQNLNLSYNKTNSAVLTFISPSEIVYAATTTADYTTDVVVSNTGDWNATNCLFQAVSSGTPNYNSKLSYNIFNLTNGTNVTINLTLTEVNIDAEPDERLQFYCTGTDSNQTVYSSFIDLDITYEAPSSTGGSGGSDTSTAQFEIVGQNAFNKETAQLSIRPNAERELCLDIINYDTNTQVIWVECDNPSGQVKDVCKWFGFDNQTVTVQPSKELRSTFCMKITTPFDIQIGDRYVANIKGTALSPSNLKGTKFIHPVTMWITDPSMILSEVWAKLKETTIMDAFYGFIKTNIKEDIEEFKIPNFINPFLLFAHFLMYLLVRSLIKKAGIWLHLIVQLFLLLFTLGSMFYPVMLFWVYLFTLVILLSNSLLVWMNVSKLKKYI